MQYLQLGNFQYDEAPSEQVMFFGRDNRGVFIHQVIRDDSMQRGNMTLSEAVGVTNDATTDFVEGGKFSIEFGDIETQVIDGREYQLCKQVMTFDDGNMSVQENVYFYDEDGGLRMMQFGTSQMDKEIWETNGDGLTKYVVSTTKRLLAAMGTNGEVVLPIGTYSFAL